MKNLVFVFLFISLSANIYSQDRLVLLNSVDLDTARYDQFIGSPYFFEDWTLVDVVSVGGVSIDAIKGNYNGLEGEWEIFQKGKYTNLPQNLYTEVKVTFDESHKMFKNYPAELSFSSNVHPKIKDKYVMVLIDHPGFQLIEEFYAIEHENKKETPGKTMTTKTIKRKSIYKVVYQGKLRDMKASKKGIINTFGHKKEIEAQLGKSKNKLKTAKELTLFINELYDLGLIK